MEKQNPWWINETDEVYEKWKLSQTKWIPRFIKQISLEPFSLNFVVGPRQVGKTTAMKILIHELLEQKDPKSIFYYSCDELIDHRELGEVIDNYVSARNEWGIKGSIIILDEITFVNEWWRAVKARIDSGLLKNDAVVITGSASLELLEQKEYFPGRRGHGKDIHFLPLDFAQYVKIFGETDTKQDEISNPAGIRKAMDANKIFLKTISGLFSKYLRTGGFPLSIKDYFERGKISMETTKTCLDWLRGDWKKAGKSDKYMKEVINYILLAKLSPVSWLNIAKETSINSPHTTESYIGALENLFAVKVLNLISPDSRVWYRKNKKIHVLDPFIYHVFSHFTGTGVSEELIAESVAASHLSRVSEAYYWRNGTEIDIVSLINGKQVGFEVKWGIGSWRKPKHIKEHFLLAKENLPLFLCSVDWQKRQ